MGKAGYNIKEIRFVIGEELIEAYYLLQAWGDSPLGVTGWHHKTFGPSIAVVDIIELHSRGEEDPVLWSLDSPER